MIYPGFEQSKTTPGRPLEGQDRNHLTNMATRSHIACKCGLEEPQGGADFFQAFLGRSLEWEVWDQTVE